SLWVIGIDCESIRAVCSFWERYLLPMLRVVAGPIQGAVSGVADAGVFRAARDHEVESFIRSSRESPRERLVLSDALILERPRFAVIGALVNAAAERCYVEHPIPNLARWIKKDVGWRRLRHAIVRCAPVFSSVITAADAPFVVEYRVAAPHLRARKIMSAAVHAPHAAFDLGIEHEPIGGIQPPLRYSGG